MTDVNPYEFQKATDGQGQIPVQPMQPVQIVKPTSVTVFGVLNCVFGGIALVCTPFSILMIFGAEKLAAMSQGQAPPIEYAPVYKIILLVSSVVGIGFSVWLLALGIGLLKFKRWARSGSVIYACIVIIWGIAGLAMNIAAYSMGWITAPGEGTPGYVGGMVGGMCGGIIGLIYPVLLLIFMKTSKVKEAFAAGGK